jgi:hypothetical protein
MRGGVVDSKKMGEWAQGAARALESELHLCRVAVDTQPPSRS